MNQMRTFLFALILFGFPPFVRAQGVIVSNGITAFPGNTVHVRQTITNTDFTGLSLDYQGTNLFLFSPFLDEGVRTFIVSSNASMSLQPVLAMNYPELLFPNNYFFANGSQFYLGFYTGSTFPQNGIYNDPLFGWGRFSNNNGVIQMLDSALEYGGGGIVVGTQTILPVPEPSSLALLALGSLLLASRRLRFPRTG